MKIISAFRMQKLSIAVLATIALSTSVLAQDIKNPHAQEKIGTVQQVYDGVLMPDIQANTFRNIDRLFATAQVKHDSSNVLALPKAEKQLENIHVQVNGKDYDLYDYISVNRIGGLLVLKDGKIAHENYQLGNTQDTKWMSMSVVKSVTASLIGAAIQDATSKVLTTKL